MNLRSTIDWIASWILLLLLTALAAAGILYGSAGVTPGATLITLATCITGIAALLSPISDETRPRAVLLWAAMAASGFLVLLLMPDVHVTPGLGFRLAGGVLVLVLLTTSLHSALRGHTASRTVASMWLVLLLGLFSLGVLNLSARSKL